MSVELYVLQKLVGGCPRCVHDEAEGGIIDHCAGCQRAVTTWVCEHLPGLLAAERLVAKLEVGIDQLHDKVKLEILPRTDAIVARCLAAENEASKQTVKAACYGRKLHLMAFALHQAGFPTPHIGLGQGYEQQMDSVRDGINRLRERADAAEEALAKLESVRGRPFNGDSASLQSRAESEWPLSIAETRELAQWLDERDHRANAAEAEIARVRAAEGGGPCST